MQLIAIYSSATILHVWAVDNHQSPHATGTQVGRLYTPGAACCALLSTAHISSKHTAQLLAAFAIGTVQVSTKAMSKWRASMDQSSLAVYTLRLFTA